MTDLLEETDETGDERADAALGGLTRLGALPGSAHADVFEGVFTGLEQALAAVNGTSGREPAGAEDTPGRVAASPDGVPGQGPSPARGLPGQWQGQKRASADDTSDRRP